jgi:hypothetical protein
VRARRELDRFDFATLPRCFFFTFLTIDDGAAGAFLRAGEPAQKKPPFLEVHSDPTAVFLSDLAPNVESDENGLLPFGVRTRAYLEVGSHLARHLNYVVVDLRRPFQAVPRTSAPECRN